jgi:hypothetical protein
MPVFFGVDQTLRVLRIIHGTFIVTVFLYLYVLSIVPHQPADIAPSMYWGLVAIAFFALLAALFVRKRMVGVALERLRVAPDDAAALGNWRKFGILACALLETIALFGFSLRILGADWAHVAPFFVVAVGTLLLTFPQRP